MANLEVIPSEVITPDALTMSPLRISTTVTTCHAGCGIRLKKLFDEFSKWSIPFGYPGEGFLKMEYENKVIGSSTRDVLTKRKLTDKTFFNQATLVIRKTLPGRGWKEVNIKLFANGGIQMTGVPTPEFSQQAITYVIDEIKKKSTEVFTGDAAMTKFCIQLINSDYSINRQIYQDKLHKILSNVYSLFSSHESTIYQGVNTKYYYNKKRSKALRPGICNCTASCNGQGNGDGDGQCKRITISPFSSGKIIITGARDMDQINEAYEFFNVILERHQQEILFTA
jgi:TATA-box binding protein (TBP) (component of TFIID and TFIIIB)